MVSVAGRSARMTTAFVKVGLSGDYGGTWFLTQLVGSAKARELYFLSDVLDATQIEALGLANRVVDDAELSAEMGDNAPAVGGGMYADVDHRVRCVGEGGALI